jgi:NAD(P)-dependent dehydrogenase (short-subunit alcohol dehydrogenase family)
MASLLKGKTAVVTGGSSGNGRAIATTFAEEGADIVVADIREEPREGGAPTHERIERETERRVTYVECDVSDVTDLETAVDAADAFGGVDIMVNNAGIFTEEEFFETTEAEFDRMMDINVKGVFFGSKLAAERMRGGGSGSIINLSSNAGIIGNGDFVVYSTTKGAVRLMSYALGSHLGPDGIRVNALHPGFTETAMTTQDVPVVGTEEGEEFAETIPTKRFGQPEDIADAAVFLASDMADYVNASSLVVDGGLTYSQ